MNKRWKHKREENDDGAYEGELFKDRKEKKRKNKA